MISLTLVCTLSLMCLYLSGFCLTTVEGSIFLYAPPKNYRKCFLCTVRPYCNQNPHVGKRISSKTKCNESTFSSYHQGFQTEKTFMHVPSKIQIQSLTCTVRVKISNALCNRQKNVNKILGTGQKVSNFKMSSDQFILVSPKDCHNSQIEGRLDLKLGPDKIPLTGIRGEETHFEIYLGGSSLNLQNGFIECDSVAKRVFMSKNKPNELMGGNIVKADITLTIKHGKADFLMRDNLLLTSRGEKIIFDEKYSQVKLTPFFPTIVDKMSMLLFYFPTDYRITKLFNFGKFGVLQFNSVNGSSPSLLRLQLVRIMICSGHATITEEGD